MEFEGKDDDISIIIAQINVEKGAKQPKLSNSDLYVRKKTGDEEC